MTKIKNLFWGYVDDEGVVHVKRYTDDRTIRNYEQMPFCKGIFDPYEARDFAHAKLLAFAKYRSLN